MAIEPVGDTPGVIDPVPRLPAPRELVRVVLVADEDRFLAQDLEGDEELLGLLDRAAVILLRVQEEERRRHLLDVRQGRALDEHKLDFAHLLAIARSLRESIDWPAVRSRTAHHPYAGAFFRLIEDLGVVSDRTRGEERSRVVVG